ncbi:hypothetical protein HKX17_17170 [Sulfitobacter sp. KE34]|uniref:Uncharacterized protein n=1 Tax=Sulfitobacter faviae TaxID=1775881 RepID=A0AAX3LS46_9RHOB|nr:MULTISPECIES: hypothetical protein [Sulfitobacter]MDF3351879.1 hypothetical protein [Sulfitobacter sp. KE12]MDF3355551.1 hypothetical protein [Sulfitobacter sp. KE27]MDF3359199.1 hypothetical protein [Sulfitobacter sp. KE33]MDF3361304.1 hypothetical protein [Sulfitobacter sp. Ks41]MDF3366623.1 hypothetical protein [Sulfitobacter sp. Ks34]|tara:strand:+ start:656 stop:925 length:270 start_codon:yes stop_codon:yes gene_type:complete
MDHITIVELVENVAWLALTGEPSKARATGPRTPTRHSYRKAFCAVFEGVNIDSTAGQFLAQSVVVIFQVCVARRVLGLDDGGIDHDFLR